VYGASKAALKLLTEGPYAELLNTNVKVTLVYSGAIVTNIAANSGVRINVSAEDQRFFSAKMIVDAIEQDRYSVLVGSDARFMDFIYRLNPKGAAGFIYKQMKSLLPASTVDPLQCPRPSSPGEGLVFFASISFAAICFLLQRMLYSMRQHIEIQSRGKRPATL
jgi:hypothetical protein